MRKVLLGTTALLGAALIAGDVQAQLEVTVGGYVRFDAGWFSDDLDGTRFAPVTPANVSGAGPTVSLDSTDRTSFDFRSRTNINIDVTGVADNGLRYGARARILQDGSANSFSMDETLIYLSGSWGRLEFGDEDGAADTMAILTPGAGTGGVFGQWHDWAGWVYDDAQKPIDSSDSTKIIYYTPRFSGFQFGISYAPYGDADGQGNRIAGRDTDQIDTWIEVGANYVGNFDGIAVQVGGTYSYANAPSGTQNLSAWMAGATVGFGGFTVGANYVRQGGSLTPAGSGINTWAWSVGATYRQGPWSVGLNYVYADFDGRDTNWRGLGSLPTERAWAVGLGAGYTIAPGMSLLADVVYFDARSTDDVNIVSASGGDCLVNRVCDTRADNDGWVGTMRLNVAF